MSGLVSGHVSGNVSGHVSGNVYGYTQHYGDAGVCPQLRHFSKENWSLVISFCKIFKISVHRKEILSK